MFSALQHVKVYDAKFFDFDNDGFQDLIIAGESEEKAVAEYFCIIMTEKEILRMYPALLPEDPKSGSQITLFDYNDDGDLDVLIAGINGGVYSFEK